MTIETGLVFARKGAQPITSAFVFLNADSSAS